jgi:hypothetical protein
MPHQVLKCTQSHVHWCTQALLLAQSGSDALNPSGCALNLSLACDQSYNSSFFRKCLLIFELEMLAFLQNPQNCNKTQTTQNIK